MVEQAAGLSSRALDAIAELEQCVLAADGGRLKLEWRRLRDRSGDRVEDLLWWEDDRLLGFLGFYGYGPTVELAGMVAPDARRRGIGTALLDAAVPFCRERDVGQVLLIVPRPSEPGRRLALRRDGALDHSEHALVLIGDPTSGTSELAVSLRPASATDLDSVARLLALAFGEPAPRDLAGRLDSPHEQTLVIELNDSIVGTLLTTQDGEAAGIYGFAVDPPLQGQGIGRVALRGVCEQLRAQGAQRIGLEVAVDNDRALGLYTSVGFTPVITEDYYALPLT